MNPEILEYMKNHNGIALDEVDENNIRKVIVFYPTGHFCGYIGIPEDNPLYGAKLKVIDNTLWNVHGGITYCEKSAPYIVPRDAKRFWAGFDYNQSFDGKDFDLVAEIYGKEEEERARVSCIHRRQQHEPVSFEEVFEQVEWMAETAGERTLSKDEEEMER